MRAAPLAVCLLLPLSAAAAERAVDAPAAAPPAGVSLMSVQPLSPLAVPLTPAAPGLSAPSAAAALTPAPAPAAALPSVAPAAPALPATAIPAAVDLRSRPELSGARPARSEHGGAAGGVGVAGASGSEGSLESDAWTGGALFDNALARAQLMSAFTTSAAGSPASQRYQAAVRAAERDGWKSAAAGVADAAAALLAERGVRARRGSATLNGEAYDTVTIAAERGVSPLNDLAYDLARRFGASADFIPGRTRSASGGYSAKTNRLMLSGLDAPDFFLATLHEARHAWYSARLRRGDIRLFHMQVVARPGRAVAPGAQVYESYFSFEELSTFPKSLKHMLTERAKLDGDAAAYIEERLGVRALQLADLLKSSSFVARQLVAMGKSGALEPRRMSDAEVAASDLQAVPGLDYFEQALPQGWIYIAVPRRKKKVLGFAYERSSAKEARAALRLRAELLEPLVDASAPSLMAYYQAVKARDWAAANAAADRLIAAARDAEAAWSARSPHH